MSNIIYRHQHIKTLQSQSTIKRNNETMKKANESYCNNYQSYSLSKLHSIIDLPYPKFIPVSLTITNELCCQYAKVTRKKQVKKRNKNSITCYENKRPKLKSSRIYNMTSVATTRRKEEAVNYEMKCYTNGNYFKYHISQKMKTVR